MTVSLLTCSTVGAQFALPRAVLPPTSMDGRIERVVLWALAAAQHEPGTADEAAALIGSWSNAQMAALQIDLGVLLQLMRNPGGVQFNVRLEGAARPLVVRYTSAQLRRLKVIACAGAGTVSAPQCADAATALEPGLLQLATAVNAAKARGDGDNYLIRRGALLHADVAMLVPPALEPLATGVTGRSGVRLSSNDGQQHGLTASPVHWELARALLDHIKPADARMPAPGRDDMVRQWYRATASWMQHREDHDTDHLDRARGLFPTDPDILFLSAAQHEVYAAPETQAVTKTLRLPAGFTLGVGSAHDELRLADGFYQRALAARPDMAEARLRRGRVLSLLGKHDEAAAELQRALGLIRDPLMRYYGHLYLGAAEEARGRFDPAGDAYLEAGRLYPSAQSPRIALAALARRRGDRGAALRELRHLFELPPNDGELRQDPFWAYHVAQARDADQLLDALWKPFRKGRE